MGHTLGSVPLKDSPGTPPEGPLKMFHICLIFFLFLKYVVNIIDHALALI